jgi:hypothetical protein
LRWVAQERYNPILTDGSQVTEGFEKHPATCEIREKASVKDELSASRPMMMGTGEDLYSRKPC